MYVLFMYLQLYCLYLCTVYIYYLFLYYDVILILLLLYSDTIQQNTTTTNNNKNKEKNSNWLGWKNTTSTIEASKKTRNIDTKLSIKTDDLHPPSRKILENNWLGYKSGSSKEVIIKPNNNEIEDGLNTSHSARI